MSIYRKILAIFMLVCAGSVFAASDYNGAKKVTDEEIEVLRKKFAITDEQLEVYIKLLHYAKLRATATDPDVIDELISEDIQNLHDDELSDRSQQALWEIAMGYRDQVFTSQARESAHWHAIKNMLIFAFIAFLKAIPKAVAEKTLSLGL